jgi:hypothetical protein
MRVRCKTGSATMLILVQFIRARMSWITSGYGLEVNYSIV